MIVIIVGLLYWLWDTIVARATELFAFLGWGLVFTIAAILSIVIVIWQKKIAWAIYHWNPWLGSVSLALAAWGILAFIPTEGILSAYGLGGSFGQRITGQDITDYPTWLSILRILGLVITGLAIQGIGHGFFSSSNSNAIMGSVDKRFFGVASGAVGTMRSVGQMLSIGIVLILFSIYIGKAQITPEYYPAFLVSIKVGFIIYAALCFGGIFVQLAGRKMRQE